MKRREAKFVRTSPRLAPPLPEAVVQPQPLRPAPRATAPRVSRATAEPERQPAPQTKRR